MAATQSLLMNSSEGSGSQKMFTTLAIMPEKEPRPTVTHIITDEDLGALQGEKLKPVDFGRVVKLLTDPHTALLVERHILALKKVTKHYASGFLMKDVVHVSRLLIVCADRVETNPVYAEPLCNLLKICALPLLMEKSSDELAYRQIASETISQIGFLLRVSINEIRIQVCKTLVGLYTSACHEQSLHNLKPTDLRFNQVLIEESDVAQTLVKWIPQTEHIQTRLAIIDVLQRLSRNSKLCCDQMLLAGAAYRLCSRLTDPDPSGELVFRSVEVIWNLIEQGESEDVARQLSHLRCIAQIRDAFLQQISRGYSHYDRQLRNDLIVMATLLATTDYTAPFLETGFAKQLTLIATFQEVKSHNPLVKNLKLMKNHEDFELKKLLINLLVILSNDQSMLPILSDGNLMLALMHYIQGNETTSKPQDWTPAYFEELQLHAISALATLGPKMIEDYITCNGSTRILLLLEWCISPVDFGGHGNSFHGTGGRGNKRAQMRHCLRLMYSMVTTGEEIVLQEFVDQGAITMLNGILTSCSQSDNADDAIDVEMQQDMLLILGALCENDIHRKELFGTEGVDNLIRYLTMNKTKFSSGLGHHRLMLATVDCIWCAVLGCYSVEDYFLEKEGVFLLLDLLENCSQIVYNQILGCLLDLSENVKTIPHISTWRGKSAQCGPHLLCEIWRLEEANLDVSRQENGAMGDLRYPLMGEAQRNADITTIPGSCPSRAIVEVSENVRAKIYSLFCRLGYIDLPGITVEDHVTLTVIERYLDFKMGEVWTEIHTELEEEGIRPISPDLEALEWIGRCVEEESIQVAQTQVELFEAQHQQDVMEEQEYYAEIRENHKQKEKTIQDFEDFVSRTSNYEKLRHAKEKQQASIEASRIMTKYKESNAFHSADIPNMQATVFSNQIVTVESTPTQIFGGHLTATNRFALPNAKRGGPGSLLGSRTSTTAGRSVELVK